MSPRKAARRKDARLTIGGIVYESLWVLGLGGFCLAICVMVFFLAV